MSSLNISTPLSSDSISHLAAGDEVNLSGVIYGARDAAHERLARMILNGEQLPFPIKDQIIYYVGPCPARPGEVIGSAGPTTSSRMDRYLPSLLNLGLLATIGKGPRSDEAKKSMLQHGAVYLVAIGGTAALLTRFIKSCEAIAFADLGPEAVFEMKVEEMPLIVAYDSKGNDIFKTGPERYKRS